MTKPQDVQFGSQPRTEKTEVQFGNQPETDVTVTREFGDRPAGEDTAAEGGVVPEYAGGDPVPAREAEAEEDHDIPEEAGAVEDPDEADADAQPETKS